MATSGSLVDRNTDDDIPLLKDNYDDDEPISGNEIKCDVEKLDKSKMLFRGYCIVIDNISQPVPTDEASNPGKDNSRQSIPMDPISNPNKQNVEHIFGDLFGFHVQYYTQLTVSAIKRLLNFVSQVDHSKFTGLIIVTLCRGYGDAIYCAEFEKTKEKISLNEIAQYFSDENCPDLMGKPVILLHDIWQQPPPRDSRGNTGERAVNVSIISCIYRIVCHCPEALQSENGISFFLKLLRQEAELKNVLLKDMLERTMLNVMAERVLVRYDGDMKYPLWPLQEMTLSEQALRLGAELQMALDVWLPMRRNVIEELETKKERIVEVCRKVRISRIAGGAAGVTGGIMSVAGFALIPFTFGGSLLLTGIGAGIAVAGGVTAIGATIADLVINKKELREANDLLTLDRQLCQVMNSLRENIRNIAERIASEDPRVNVEQVIVGILRGGQSAVRVGMAGIKAGITVAQLAEMGGIAALEGSVFALRLTSVAARGIAVVGGLVSALIIPLDIYEIVSNSIKLSKQSPTAASKWLQEQIDFLKLQEEEIKKTQEEKSQEE